MTPTTPTAYVTRQLTQGENVLQAGWAKANSGLLERMDVDGARITIRRRNGAVDELQKGAFRCTSYRTGSGRRLFVIRANDGRKIRLMEMNGMLSAGEWDEIADHVLESVPSNLNQLIAQAGIAIMLGMFAAAVSAGLLAGLFGLDDSQVSFWSPLSIGLMVAWTVALWFGIKLIRKLV